VTTEEIQQIDIAKVLKDDAYREELAGICQRDLLTLGRVLGYDKLIDEVHEPVALLAVLKDPAKSIEDQSPVKERIHLDPRGCYKSTLSIIDCIQWIICFPDVRICILTATKPLAQAIVGEISGHFVRSMTGEPTLFQAIFPKFTISPRDDRTGLFTAPNRKRKWREATVMAFSIETSISGWHFDVLCVDDVVDTQNSKTDASIAAVKSNYFVNLKTLMPWGFKLTKATRYNPFDLTGQLLKKAKPGRTQTLVRGALRLNSGKRLEPGDFPAESEVTLLFPQLLSYEFLKEQFELDYGSFMSQYMNDASGGNLVIFSESDMLNACLLAEQLPLAGMVRVAWRLEYAANPAMKFSGGAAGVMHNGRMHIMEHRRGQFLPSKLAREIVLMCKRHGTHTVHIEATPGAIHYEPEIRNQGVLLGWHVNVSWIDYEEDEGRRKIRLKALQPMIEARRLLFNAESPQIMQLREQFESFGMIDENEIVDAVARVAEALPKTILASEDNEQFAHEWESLRQKQMHDVLYGEQGISVLEIDEADKVPPPPTNSYGLHEMLGGLDG